MNDRPNPGWFGRNWKWFVPTGCLSVLLFAALALAGLIGLGIKGVSGLMSGSEPVRHAMDLAKANPDIRAAFGEPLETGMGFQGSLTTNNDSGEADLSLPIKGPKGSGRIYVKGTREADRWSYRLIEVAIDGSERRIDLLGADAAPDAAPEAASPERSAPDESTPEEESDPEAPAEESAAA
ncbi:cytochrome c oxidase assembly factor Coa1 family protein [Lysobacter yananisis]|uniref:Cytochrome c oxidase assembly factor Coa1 family protein n=1 Tax=Lysobacter yananisis TaxID=1003114 RepID=A0ABY9PC12_9GAMM|nr:cytochrome c oxidase assembly factor Coa1 family protein [Lysobacter yananisis]WMT04612.1 cytochrome c oxidase assembly factor Coa1 family protein [Lysobacter yananisis]